MIVKLESYTPNPDNVCGFAARNCIAESIPELDEESNNVKSLKAALASGHMGVLENATFTFSIEGVSRITETQLVRHRLASFAIQSGRYCTRDPTNYMVPFDTESVNMDYIREYNRALKHLDNYLEEMGIAPEDRRYFYPQGLLTNIIVTMNARQLMHFFKYRVCNRAQWEIRELAKQMLALCKEVAPTIFANAGANCVQLGYCIEQRGCGKYPKKS